MAWSESIRIEYDQMKREILEAGGEKRKEREHQKGKLTARERLEHLFDDGVFEEIEAFRKSRIDLEDIEKKHYIGDGVIAGFGKVYGVRIYAVAQDCTISGGSGGEAHVYKICRALELAIQDKCPIIFLCDSGGARIEEGIISLSAYSKLFHLNTMASGYIPQIAAIMGNCAGGSSYSPAMCDFVFMVEGTGQFFITGPKVIKALTGEDITMEQLGGAKVHSEESGQAHFVCKTDVECINQIKKLVEYICIAKKSITNKKKINYLDRGREIEDIIPMNKKQPYDVHEVIDRIMDAGDFMEILPSYAQNLVMGFSRLNGKTIGIVANQPNVLGGALDCDSAVKCARFVRTCDCFDIPILVLVDVPGYFPGSKEEKKGILRSGSKILYAFSEASVPKISVIMRKAYGGAYCAMNSKEIGADMVYAWPICEIAVMGSDGAVDVMHGKQLDESEQRDKFRQEKIDSYENKYLNPYFAASYGMVDDVILPYETRDKLIRSFENLERKRKEVLKKKHGNISL